MRVQISWAHYDITLSLGTTLMPPSPCCEQYPNSAIVFITGRRIGMIENHRSK